MAEPESYVHSPSGDTRVAGRNPYGAGEDLGVKIWLLEPILEPALSGLRP